MIKNFLIITLRNLWRDKSATSINIIGFSTGLAAFLVIVAFVRNEMSFEKFNANADRIFRANIELTIDGKPKIATVSANILGPRMKEEVPEVLTYVRIFGSFNMPTYISAGENNISCTKFFYADSTIFDVFTIRMLRGSTKGLLCNKNELIISESAAKKYFGNVNIEGKMIRINYKEDYLVKGIFRDFPATSHFHPEIIAPFIDLPAFHKKELTWESANYFTYLLLNSPQSHQAVEKKLKEIASKELPDYFKSTGMTYSLFPIRNIHLYSRADFEPEPVGDIKQVQIFIAIAIFIILLAVVNYVNMATSKSIERAREVGLRKIMGSYRRQIIGQFLGESAFLSGLAMILALAIALASQSMVTEIFQRPIDFGFLLEPLSIALLLILWILLSFFAGLYPSILLSMFEPVYVMKGSFKRSRQGALMRKGLVVFQFIISAAIIIATLVVYRQLNYMQNQKLGFDKEKILAINVVSDPSVKFDPLTFKKQVLQHGNIESVTVASAYPTHNLGGQIVWAEGMDEKATMLIWGWETDEDFIKTLGLELLTGKNLNPEIRDPKSTEFIINETSLKQIGWTLEDCIGKKINMGYRQGACVGVVKDFHYTTLKSKIEPLMFFIGSDMMHNILVRITGKDVRGTVNFIGDQWKTMASSIPFEYHFLDEQYNALYKNEANTGKIFAIFSMIAIIIACLGLFALSTYETLTRTKEIGIRKALGSTEFGVFNLLMRNFGIQVILSFIIAIPLSWFFMNKWLEGFAYRVDISPVIYFISGLIIICITFLTVSYHSLRAAFRNPVLSLRYE